MKYLFLLVAIFFIFQQNAWSKDILDELLIANQNMPDPRFKETVIILFHHNQTGAVGLVVNKPIKTISIGKLFEDMKLTLPTKVFKKNITLYWGGPVEPEQIFIIHSSDYESRDFISSNKNFTVSRSPEVLNDIAKNQGPEEYLFIIGISVWEPGQLDFEIMQGDWRKKLSSYSLIFNNDDEMWQRLLYSQDI